MTITVMFWMIVFYLLKGVGLTTVLGLGILYFSGAIDKITSGEELVKFIFDDEVAKTIAVCVLLWHLVAYVVIPSFVFCALVWRAILVLKMWRAKHKSQGK